LIVAPYPVPSPPGRADSLKSKDIAVDPFARIVNRTQRDALVRAIEARGDIPDYAWTPLPAEVSDAQWREIREFVRPAAEAYVRDLLAGKAEPLW